MSNNRKIGFEVLENANENKIKEMGADSPILTQNAKDRMLKMSKEKFSKAKGITAEANADNDGYTVSGDAETYKRSNIKRIVTAAASCAAAAVLIGTTMLMFHNKPDAPVVPDQNITTDADPNVTNTGTTVTHKGTGTATTTATETVTEYTTVTTYVAKDFNITSPVPQSDIEEARKKVLDVIDRENKYAFDIRYKYEDLNADNVPELLVVYQTAYPVLELYRYNGSEFVYDINEEGFNANSYCFTNDFGISSDRKCIKLVNREGGTVNYYVTMGDDYSIDTLKLWTTYDWEYYEKHRDDPDPTNRFIYYRNNDVISAEEYNSIKAKYDAIDFSYFDLTEFTLYKEKSDAFIEREKEMQEEERQILERRKADPHCDDFASVYIDKAYFLNNGILESGTQYIVEHTDTYCDGTVLVETDVNDTYSDDPDNNRLAFTVGYGKNDDAPCHIHVRCRPKDKQEYIDLFDIDIDFKNKTYDCGDIMFSDSIRVEYVYFSECYNNE